MSVTSLADTGAGSLRDAIEMANTNPGPDTIEFDSGLEGATIELQSELAVTDFLTLNPDFVDITISGAAADPTPGIADGMGIRLFQFNALPVTPSFSPSHIYGLTLTGGDVTGSGGAVHSTHGIVLDQVTVENNFATVDGGGVYISAEESSGFGIRESYFANNTAEGDGGAAKLIGNSLGYAAVENSEFRHNEATRGGAVDVENHESFVVVSDSLITENEAQIGGGINFTTDESGMSQIERTTVSNNTAARAGGVASLVREFGFFVMFDVNVTGNLSNTDSGGAMIASQGDRADSRISNSSFTENHAGLEGGGLTMSGSQGGNVSGTSLTVADNTSDYTGGGIRILAFDGARVGSTNSRISGNHGLLGGGADMLVGSDALSWLFNTAVYDNTAVFDGGGVNIEATQLNATARVVNTTVSGNTAGRDGGGIHLFSSREGHQISLEHSTVANNVAGTNPSFEGRGGGVSGGFFASTQSITHSIVAGNRLGLDGETLSSDLGGQFGADFSLIQSIDEGAGATGAGNLFDVDPQLSQLSDSGGRSMTHAIARTSPAYNAGAANNAGPFTFDQRGTQPFDRVVDGRIDIGAFELGSAPTGNFDVRGGFGCEDIDALVEMIVAGDYSAQFDMNQDAILDRQDVDVWLDRVGEINLGPGRSYLPGDANLDGAVDISDFNIWNAHKFSETAAWCSGDFTVDGSVDVQDFNQWNAFRFQSSAPESNASSHRQGIDDVVSVVPVESAPAPFIFAAPKSTSSPSRLIETKATVIDELFADESELADRIGFGDLI